MTDKLQLFRFGDIAGPIALTGRDDLPGAIGARLHGWNVAPWPGDAAAPAPAIAVAARGGDFVLTSATLEGEEIYDNIPDTVCAFIAELIMAYAMNRPDAFFLHAGAAMLGGTLIVYPATGKAGKSTLTAQIARVGGRIFSDDVFPVRLLDGKGLALGIEPRLRLPLPAALGPDTRQWMEAHAGLANERMTYVGLARSGPGALAPHGEESAIGAFVLLDRAEGAAPLLAPCPRVDIMKLMVRQHFDAPMPMPQVLARFKALVEATPCWRLTYGGGDQAVDLLRGLAEDAA